MSQYVIHVLVTHTHTCTQIDTVKIVRVNRVLTLNVARQTIEKGFLRLKQLYRLEREEVGDQYTRIISFCNNKTIQQKRLFEAQSDID